MFRSPDHRYERGVPGKYRLVPTPTMRKKLSAYYEKMSAVIFATPPGFEAVMKRLRSLRQRPTRPNSPSPLKIDLDAAIALLAVVEQAIAL